VSALKRLLAFLLIAASLALVIAGVILGGAGATAQKAALICRECIGIG
jgi:hypothetical protein